MICAYTTVAQDVLVDTTGVFADTVNYFGEQTGDEITRASIDTTHVRERAFPEEKMEALRADTDLHYTQPPTVVESLWDRFKVWLARLLGKIINATYDTSWGNILGVVIIALVIAVIVYGLVRKDGFSFLFSSKRKVNAYAVLEENIHEMNFDQLLDEAIQQNDYRRAVRLLFLHALKLLSDRDLIHWQPGKTNHEYAAELDDHNKLKPGFDQLNYYFDYVWYGNFDATASLFERARKTFSAWREQLR